MHSPTCHTVPFNGPHKAGFITKCLRYAFSVQILMAHYGICVQNYLSGVKKEKGKSSQVACSNVIARQWWSGGRDNEITTSP